MSYSVIPKSVTFPANNLLIAENAYRILLNGLFENGTNFFVDSFSTAAGVNSTANVGTSTTEFDIDGYTLTNAGSGEISADISNFNSTNFNDITYNVVTLTSGFFSQVTMQRSSASVQGDFSLLDSLDNVLYTEPYNFSTSTNTINLTKVQNGGVLPAGTYKLRFTTTSGTFTTQTGYNSNKTEFSVTSQEVVSINGSIPFKFTPISYGLSDELLICDNNTISFDGTETILNVFVDATTPLNTNITFNITDGTTTLLNQEVGTDIDITIFTTGNAILTFNLSTTDTTITPKIKGYSTIITK